MLRRLSNLLAQIHSFPGHKDALPEAGNTLQVAFVKRFKNKKNEDGAGMFKAMSPEETELATKIFNDLSNFSELKFIDLTGQLTYSRECITKALTRPKDGYKKEDYEEAATQNFRNILVCMGDKPAQGCLKFAAEDAVIDLASSEFALRAEVYLQVLKQLQGNPSPRSEKMGYEILHSLCLQSPPTGEVAEFVRTFLKKQQGSSDFGSDEFDVFSAQRAGGAKACLTVLDTGDVDPSYRNKTRGAAGSNMGRMQSTLQTRQRVTMD